METTTLDLPDTLVDCVRYFSDPKRIHNFAVAMRWPDGVICPYCKSPEHSFISTRKTWQCKVCKKQFSVKVCSIFEESRLPLDKWFVAMWLISNAKNGISSHELGRSLGVTQKTAWFLNHRIRHIMQTGSFDKMEGTVECDETFIGQKAKNMHADKKEERIHGRGTSGKAIVLGILERGNTAKDENGNTRKKQDGIFSQMHTKVVPDTTETTLCDEIKATVGEGTEVFTDALKSYRALGEMGFKHAFVDHAIRYVEGWVHTSGCENYWGLLDRMLHGTYVYCLPHHLFRYTDELTYRFNHRDGTDLTRFLQAMQQVSGKRLTYDKLTTNHLKYIMPMMK